jgi:hypothetical protein
MYQCIGICISDETCRQVLDVVEKTLLLTAS